MNRRNEDNVIAVEGLDEKYIGTIVYWRGGGYDGCIWEPNMGFIDFDGNWHPVISTGHSAIDDTETLLIELRDMESGESGHMGMETRNLDQSGVDWLCDNVRVDYVAHFVDKVNEYMSDRGEAGFDMKCTHCGKHFSSCEYSFREIVDICADSGYYHGDGGIGIIVTDILCDDCRYELIESVHIGDWVYVSGHETLRGKSYEVKSISDDGRTYGLITGTDDDGEDVVEMIEADWCQKNFN